MKPFKYFLFLSALTSVSAHGDTSCRASAINTLRELSPEGYQIYLSDPEAFKSAKYYQCVDPVLDLANAVHETVHTSTHGRYPLIGGGSIEEIPTVDSLYPPHELYESVDPKLTHRDYLETYNPNRKTPYHSSGASLRTLMDELNAYSHDLYSSIKLHGVKNPELNSHNRDGAVALLYFVHLYAERAREVHPESWATLQNPQVKRTMKAIWNQAESAVAASCDTPDFGGQDIIYMKNLCEIPADSAIRRIVGHRPACFQACIEQRRADRKKYVDQGYVKGTPEEVLQKFGGKFPKYKSREPEKESCNKAEDDVKVCNTGIFQRVYRNGQPTNAFKKIQDLNLDDNSPEIDAPDEDAE